MKKTLLMLASLLLVVSSYGQGLIAFKTFGGGVNAPATNALTGLRIPAGATFMAQLYYGAAGAAESSLISVSNAPVPFTSVGYVIRGETYYTDPAIVAGGAIGTFQVRAWEAVLGATWDVAYINWLSNTGPYEGKVLGKSNLTQVKTGDPNSVPPGTPSALIGLTGFSLVPVPEPGVLALCALGFVALLWRRRQ